MSVLQVNDLHASYSSSGSEILKGISFDVAENDFVAIIGPSGAGKSTLIRCINRLVEPSSGSIIFKGQNITNMSKSELRRVRRDIGMIFQEFNLINRMSVMDNLLSGRLGYIGNIRTLFKAYPRKDIDRAIELLERVGLIDHIDKRADELSGGQRQRVGIARAFAGDARIVVADEPVSALDVSVQAAVTDLLMEIQRKEKTTLLFISHDLSIVRYLSDRVMVMYLGHVVELGTTDQVFSPPYHPYTEALLSAVPIADTSIVKKHVVLEGDIPSAMNPPSGCPFQTRCRWKKDVPGSLCETEIPPIKTLDGGHQIKCHLAKSKLEKMEPVIKIAAE